MKEVYLSIGSNIQPEKNIPAALNFLKQTFLVTKISSIYETEPVGPAGPEKFWNLAAVIQTGLEPDPLITKLRRIEEKLGRVRSKNKFAPRALDIDLLPQPGYQHQAFVMIPLAEIAPQVRDKETGKNFRELAKNLKESSKDVRRLEGDRLLPWTGPGKQPVPFKHS